MNEKYLAAVETIKAAILRSQSRATQNINRESLLLYYSIGGYVSGNSREGRWGTGAIDEISARLREELPGLRGFSGRNIKSMRQFYEAWQPYLQISQPLELGGKSAAMAANLVLAADAVLIPPEKRPPMATDFKIEDFTEVSFTHHMEILHTVKDVAERLFYIQASARCHWSKYTLREKLKQDLYHHQGALPNNFAVAIPDDKQYMQAIQMFKDEYFLDFINTEEFFADLLFFQRDLKALVVIELKKGKFKPAYLGQLNFYLSALDEQERKNGENPSIGILLCREANKSVVELAIRDYTKPLGVATYRTADELPGRYQVLAPIIEEAPKLLDAVAFEKGGDNE